MLHSDTDTIKRLEDAGFFTPEEMEIGSRKGPSDPTITDRTEVWGTKQFTGFPKPVKRFRIEKESEEQEVEEMYYWLVDHAVIAQQMTQSIKVVDSHAASVAASTFGDSESRLSAQQSTASNYLATMGKLLKDMFALVRELRQLDERLQYYLDSNSAKSKDAQKIAESTLKDIWITLVEQGTQNPSSVYGMAQKVGFTILPDLFFQSPPFNNEQEIADYSNSLEFNKAVLAALERKLNQFRIWKVNTHQELINKRSFQIRYLRQHFEVIKMYMAWIAPYLRNIKALQRSDKYDGSGDLINSFETQVSEIETLVIKPAVETGDPKKSIYGVVSFHFMYRTRPQMGFHAKESWQQKGPVHVGKTQATIRTYGWSGEQIEKYKQYREKEAFDMYADFDASVSDALEYLGEDIERYLKESEAKIPKGMFSRLDKRKEKEAEEKKKKTTVKPAQEGLADFIIGPFKGIAELFGPMLGSKEFYKSFFSSQSNPAMDLRAAEKANQKSSRGADFVAWQCYKNYKKSHKMISW
ncbi:MAG: hypothetical protein ACI8Y7_000654 [Candidatus Woesearchaeota archaeon]|jgi:hypothetical protein